MKKLLALLLCASSAFAQTQIDLATQVKGILPAANLNASSLANSGILFNTYYQGSYSSGATYTIGQMVLSSSITYISLVNSNTGNTPASSPTFWAAISTAGSGCVGSCITGITVGSTNSTGPVITFKNTDGNLTVTVPSTNLISIDCPGCGTNGFTGTLSTGQIPMQTSSALVLGPSGITSDGTTVNITGTGGLKLSGTGPGSLSWVCSTGNIPTLQTGSAGFAAPVCSGTPYLIKLPATMVAGIPHFSTPATGDGVNEVGWSQSLINLADLNTTGTPLSSNYLAGDYSWKTVPGSTNPLGGGVNAQTGTTYTVVTGDATKIVTFSNASAIAVTIANPTTTGFGSGNVYHFKNLFAGGTVTITSTSSLIDGQSTAVLVPGEGVELWSDGTNYSIGGHSMYTSTAIPTVACNTAGSGTGCSAVMATGSTNASGQIQLTTGTSGQNPNAAMVTMTFANGGFKKSSGVFCTVTPASYTAANIPWNISGAATRQTTLAILSGSSSPPISQPMYYNYNCPE